MSRIVKDDPVSVHVLADNNDRRARMKSAFQTTNSLGVYYGEVHATSPNLIKNYKIKTLKNNYII